VAADGQPVYQSRWRKFDETLRCGEKTISSVIVGCRSVDCRLDATQT
jgi:hypothetical protein